MTKQSAIYLFRRDDRSPFAYVAKNEAATDAIGVVLNWAVAQGRAIEALIDDHEIFVARLTYDASEEEAAAADLDARCRARALTRVGIDEMEMEKLRGAPGTKAGDKSKD